MVEIVRRQERDVVEGEALQFRRNAIEHFNYRLGKRCAPCISELGPRDVPWNMATNEDALKAWDRKSEELRYELNERVVVEVS